MLKYDLSFVSYVMSDAITKVMTVFISNGMSEVRADVMSNVVFKVMSSLMVIISKN